jgi:hypothetical protein
LPVYGGPDCGSAGGVRRNVGLSGAAAALGADRSAGGQFLLTPLPGGRTRLEGTTWYRHGLAPAEYWRLWSDEIIHKIHMRVLKHIKEEAEKTG